MIEVDLPDGSVAEFPDGTPTDVIRGALQKRFGAPKTQISAVDQALRPITSFPETYNEVRGDAERQMAAGVGQLQNAVQNYAPADLLRGIGNTALGAVGYVASPVNAALRTVVGQPLEENFGIPREISETAASFALPGAAATRVSAVQRARPLTQGEEVATAGQRLAGVGTTGPVNVPAAVASDSMSAQRAAAAVANVPIAGNPLVRAADDTVQGLAQKARDVASEYGSSSALTGGESASSGIRNWITGKSAETSAKFYDRVDNLVDPAVTTQLSATRAKAQSILARRANANITEASDAVRRVEEAITNPAGLNYQGIKDLRTYIGEMVDGKRLLPADLRPSELKQIYEGLSQDLSSAVRAAGGPRAVDAFNRANTHYRLVSERREALAKIVGADGNVPPEQVFERLVSMAGNSSKADINRLAQARKAMGKDDWNEVASGLIARMGQTEDATGNVIFSPQRFLTAYQTKLSPAGRNLLFRSGGKEDIAPYLDDIAKISGRFRELQRFSNPSGTGQTLAGAVGLSGLWVEPTTAISAAVGTNIMARVLARPATAASTAQWSRRYEIALREPSPANVAQLTIASRNLANTISSELGVPVSWQDLLKATQGPVPARPGDENPEPERVINQ